jgi:hypothetical protein
VFVYPSTAVLRSASNTAEKNHENHSIERIDLDIPYFERVREHLQKGWGLANRATDDEYAADKEKFQQQWRDSSPPSVTTSIYLDPLFCAGSHAARSQNRRREWLYYS